ncbi:hypothetical protein [Burkholderia cenocepacia]|uniref:hypothetical protein n=1 Tax=Burkholderia cenocepacia TaxID=95486 RepID=UPI0008470639|nr:hypothetical protein [Burkholderia cenocepacia]
MNEYQRYRSIADDAQPAIGQHDLSTSDGGRSYVAEFFAKRLRRHDFGRYITEQLAADFACALARYLSERDIARIADDARDKAHQAAIDGYLDDGWSEEVTSVVSGIVTHRTVQTGVETKPEPCAAHPEHDDEGCDECAAWNEWPNHDFETCCRYVPDLIVATHPASEPKAQIEELRRAICVIGVVGEIEGHDVIRRNSVLDIIGQRRHALGE